jgi:hypothetical protein
MAGAGQVRPGRPGNDRQADVGEVPHQRLVHPSVGGVAQGVLVHGDEPPDVVRDVADGEAQHLLGRVPAVGLPRLLAPLAARQVFVEHLDEQLQGAAVAVVERRAGHAGPVGQLGDGDLGDRPLPGEIHDCLLKGLGRPGDARIGPVSHRLAPCPAICFYTRVK